MKTPLQAVCLVVLGLCACGPGAQISGGKQGAAEALYAASSMLKAGAPTGSGIDVALEVSAPCAQGGVVSLHGFSVTAIFGTAGGNFGQGFIADYQNCGVKTRLGIALLNGSLSVNQAVAVVDRSAQVDQTIKGKLLWSGAFDDFLDLDVSQQIAVTALTQTTGGVSMILKGSIANTEGTYTFNEMVSVTPGNVTVELKAKN